MNSVFLSIGIANACFFLFELAKGIQLKRKLLIGFSFIHLTIALLAFVLELIQ